MGFEGSSIPHLGIDQYEWTQHDRWWRDDFKLVADDLTCRWVRYPLAWHRIEPSPGKFDWRWLDERVELAQQLSLNLMVGLTHFGTPTWLPHAFGDVEFPAALERFARAFGQRYAGVIHSVCPLNEPQNTALYGGEYGLWPPHGRGLANYMAVLSRVAQGMNRAITALRETMPGVEIVSCDPLEYAFTDDDADETTSPHLTESLRADVARRMQRRHLALDLVTGRLDENHELRPWLQHHGFSRFDLDWFVRHPVEVDVIGLDYYPHTETEICTSPEGHYRKRIPEYPAGLYRAARNYWLRYQRPLMIAETSVTGSEEERGLWLEYTLFEVRRLREAGIPVVGYTWWPVMDHLDWDGALLHQVGHIHPVGIYRLERQRGGRLQRVATTLRDAYRDLIRRGDEAAGALTTVDSRESFDHIYEERHESKKMMHTLDNLSYPIIVHSHLGWDWVWQRPQQFLSRLSHNHRILFVELHATDEVETPCNIIRPVPQYPHIIVLKMQIPASRFSDGAWVDRARFDLLQEALQGPLARKFESPVQWFYDPMAVTAFGGKMKEIATVYDCMDELSQFKGAPPELVQRERTLLARADVVFAGGRKIHESKSRYHSNCHFYGCGVDVEHFSKARLAETVVPGDLDFIDRPILGYFGVVDERLDYELIAKLADANPDWSIAMVGPVTKVDPNALPRRANLYWLGGREYSQLPAYAKGFDVCLMPFALNEATEYINPTKSLEYMAAARPIVSSAIADVKSNFSSVVKIAASHEAFIELCRVAITRPDQVAIERGLHMASNNTWEAIVARLESHIEDVVDIAGVEKAMAEAKRESMAVAAS
ncbi:MAG TPA: family 1 glycosylhydrolase [Abditibacteriaceae bacterium]|nr:family 1 glycosylhydrolase [Abditibacteriaceae bacterium]